MAAMGVSLASRLVGFHTLHGLGERPMPNKFWRRCGALAACLTLAAVLADAPASDSTATKKPTDPPGTTKYMDQLRKLFDMWDLNSDNFLDKEELAKAFRGADAKPYDFKKTKDSEKDAAKDDSTDSKPAKKPDYKKYPDYNFLVQLDQDGDGQISRDEFMNWARDYAVQLKDQAAQEKKLLALQTKLQNASGKEAKTLEKELKKEQAKIDKMDASMNSAEKAMIQHLKHK
jgi:Ca2+-binding EF-hand superfamily protein